MTVLELYMKFDCWDKFVRVWVCGVNEGGLMDCSELLDKYADYEVVQFNDKGVEIRRAENEV